MAKEIKTRVNKGPYYKMAFIMQYGNLKRLTPDEIAMINIERSINTKEGEVETYDINKCIYSFVTYNDEIVDNIIFPNHPNIQDVIQIIYACITEQ